MRKRLIGESTPDEGGWLDLDRVAEVEVTSEDPAHPIESALTRGGRGWRASTPGRQTIRFLFDEPQTLRVIELQFEEHDVGRTQEFVLRWSSDADPSTREIVRQQYTFSPSGTTNEIERYQVNIDGVKVLELELVPDVARGPAVASLSRLRAR